MSKQKEEPDPAAAATAAAEFVSAFPNRIVAAAVSISGFTIAIVAGLGAGNDASMVLQRAIVASVGCYLMGLVVSAVAAHVVHEHLSGVRSERPVPKVETAARESVARGAKVVEKKAA